MTVLCVCFLSLRCSLTHNFDRDWQGGFCAPEKTQPNGRWTENPPVHPKAEKYILLSSSEMPRVAVFHPPIVVFPLWCVSVFVHTSRRITDPCRVNPCQNGGLCTLIPQRGTFECSCPESFSGRLCEQSR